MRKRLVALAWVVLLAVAPLRAAVPSDESAALTRASERGAILYAYDQAAWHGTDDMRVKLPDAAERVGGYIVDGPARSPRLIFFDKNHDHAVYVATFFEGRLTDGRVMGAGDNSALSPADRQMIAAREVAAATLQADKSVRPCAAVPFNTVVLPPDGAGTVSVYFLTPQTSGNATPLGGHYEIDVDGSGRAGTVRRFTNSCISIPAHPVMPRGAKTEFFFVTHVLDQTPTEIHVFTSLAAHLSLMVGTVGPPVRIWPVVGPVIGKPVDVKR